MQDAVTFKALFDAHRGYVSDKWEGYLPVYENFLCAFKDKTVNLLEVGVQNGGSLAVWAKYFESAGTIVGCDKNPKCASLAFEDSRIKVVIGDVNRVATRQAIKAFAPSFDIIIDDGSHNSKDVIATFKHFYPLLNPGGVYLVEDLHCSYWSRFRGGLWRDDSAIEFFKTLIDVVNFQSWGVALEPNRRIARVEGLSLIKFKVKDFASIESLHFFNSMCVVKKGLSNTNVLGGRVISGTDATVYEKLPASGTPLPVRAEPENAKRLRK